MSHMKSKISIKKLRTAKSKGLLYFRKHLACGFPCDHCGKKNPSNLIIIFKNKKEKTEVLKDEITCDLGLYLNSFSYIVGSGCLRKIKKLIED